MFVIGSFYIMLALIVGALSAHALPETITLQTRLGLANAITIQMLHGLLFLIVGMLRIQERFIPRFVTIILQLMAVACLIFCLSVYSKAFSFSDSAPFAPFAGGSLIVLWASLMVYGIVNLRCKK